MNAFPSSTAVMARRAEPADSLDFFPTPPWASRALCQHVLPQLFTPERPDLFADTADDPACGDGHMALVLAEYFRDAHASDIFDYGFGRVADFLHPDYSRRTGWIITNPPFNRAVEFVEQALKLAQVGVAMLVRMQFLEGQERYARLFSQRPPQIIAQFVERVPMHKGRWVINGKTATAYCWLVWAKHPQHDQIRHDPPFRWIPPCRAELTRHDDWLNFSGCMDPPEGSPLWKAWKELKSKKDKQTPADDVPPADALADVRRELEARLL